MRSKSKWKCLCLIFWFEASVSVLSILIPSIKIFRKDRHQISNKTSVKHLDVTQNSESQRRQEMDFSWKDLRIQDSSDNG